MLDARPHLAGAMAMIIAWLVSTSIVIAQTRTQFEALRKKMVAEVIVAGGVDNRLVVRAMTETLRHEFVPRHLRENAYEDMALPIGDRQTISSPFIVAFMTAALDPQPSDNVLEIGTGSGYQAAVLSPLVKDVYTIEIVESLGRSARRTLKRLRYENVHMRIGDGFQGWPERAPFDKIIVTCSPEKVPRPLMEQLREGGLMVIPTGQSYQQTLVLLRKRNGRLQTESLRPTLFVPMTGTAEQSRRGKADPLNPQLVNAGFEKPPLPNGFVPDWYYQRQLVRVADDDAPEGTHFVTLTNSELGKQALAMQGFAIDGQKVRHLELSAWIKFNKIRPGRNNDELPVLLVTFYDENRKSMGPRWIGPFRGSEPWHRKVDTIRVPVEAREGFVRIGLFGALGEISFDDVRLRAVP